VMLIHTGIKSKAGVLTSNLHVLRGSESSWEN